MTINENQYYLIRATNAGVFAGYITSLEGQRVTMRDVRRIWYWQGAATLSQMVMEGVKYPRDCKFSMLVNEMTIFEVIEIAPLTVEAEKSIKEVPVWRIL